MSSEGTNSEFSHLCGELSKVLIEVRGIKEGIDRLLRLHEPPPSPEQFEVVTQEKSMNRAWYHGRSPTASEDVTRWKSIDIGDHGTFSSSSSGLHHVSINRNTQSPVKWDDSLQIDGDCDRLINLTATTIVPATPTTPVDGEQPRSDKYDQLFPIPDTPESSPDISIQTSASHNNITIDDKASEPLLTATSTDGSNTDIVSQDHDGHAATDTTELSSQTQFRESDKDIPEVQQTVSAEVPEWDGSLSTLPVTGMSPPGTGRSGVTPVTVPSIVTTPQGKGGGRKKSSRVKTTGLPPISPGKTAITNNTTGTNSTGGRTPSCQSKVKNIR